MTRETLKNIIKIDDVKTNYTYTLSGKDYTVELDEDKIKELLIGKLWRTAGVLKNTREKASLSIDKTLDYGVNNEIITPAEAYGISRMDKEAREEEIKKIRLQMPEVKKGKEPNDDDITKALQMVADGAGQSNF